MSQTDNDALVRGLEAWLHTVDDQDIAYFGTVVLAALRSPAPVVDGPLAGKVERPYAFCCAEGGGDPKFCDCVNKNHGTAWFDAPKATRPQPAQDEVELVARIIDPKIWAIHDDIAGRPDEADWFESWRAGSIKDGGAWGTSLAKATAAITALRQHSGSTISVAEEWGVYMNEAVSKAPEPLRQLGEYLAGLLDEDQWKTADRYLNAAAIACQHSGESGETEALRAALKALLDACYQADGLEELPECIDGTLLDDAAAALELQFPIIWTEEQVAMLKARQADGSKHPYTCGGDRADRAHTFHAEENSEEPGLLFATVRGWRCPACDYRQFWAHETRAALGGGGDA